MCTSRLLPEIVKGSDTGLEQANPLIQWRLLNLAYWERLADVRI